MASRRAVFVETAAQAASAAADGGEPIVAFTGEAVLALRRAGVAYVPVGELVQLRVPEAEEVAAVVAVVELLASLEAFVTARDEQAASRPGFLADHAYHVATALFAAAERELLVRGALRALDARAAEWPDAAATEASVPPPPERRRLRRAPRSVLRALARREDAGGKRLLFVDDPKYDWAAALARLRGVRTAVVPHRRIEPARPWSFALDPDPFSRDGEGEARYAALFDEWADAEPRTLAVGGLDLLPRLRPELRELTGMSPSLARHCDEAAERALAEHRPDAVCSFSLPWLSAKRLARRARELGVPVVCYQHGGAYATHRVAVHDLMDWAWADVFLTYGEGIASPAEPAFPLRARLVPVGSAAIASGRRRRRRASGRVRVLWIGEYVTRNEFAFGMGEDTRRHLLETGALERLAAAPQLDVTFRPYPAQAAASDVVDALHGRDVVVDATTPLAEQVARHDLVVTDTHSGTVWNQVLGWGAPLVLALDPLDVHLDPDYADELGRACRWCRTDEELETVLDDLERAPHDVLRALRALDPSAFLRRFVLHRGSPVADVAAFLRTL